MRWVERNALLAALWLCLFIVPGINWPTRLIVARLERIEGQS